MFPAKKILSAALITTTLLEGRGGLLEGEGRVCEVRKITAIFLYSEIWLHIPIDR